jgi:hypothetical protein
MKSKPTETERLADQVELLRMELETIRKSNKKEDGCIEQGCGCVGVILGLMLVLLLIRLKQVGAF